MVIAAACLIVVIIPLVFVLPTLFPPAYGGEGQIIQNDRMTLTEAAMPDSRLPREITGGWIGAGDQDAWIDGNAVGLRRYEKDDAGLYLFYSGEGYRQFTLEGASTTEIAGVTVRYTDDALYFYATWQDHGAQYCLRAFMPFTIEDLTTIVEHTR